MRSLARARVLNVFNIRREKSVGEGIEYIEGCCYYIELQPKNIMIDTVDKPMVSWNDGMI